MGRSFNRRTTQVHGLKELEKALRELPKAVARGALRTTLMKAGEPIVEAAIANAPVLSGQLRDSIKVDARKPKNFDKGKIAYREVLKTGGGKAAALEALKTARRNNPQAFAQVFVGPSVDAPHAHFPEFGTVDTAAQPFMRPAWDEKQAEALEIITADLAENIATAAARHAKRQARKAAKA